MKQLVELDALLDLLVLLGVLGHHLAQDTHPVVIINWVQYLGPPGPFSFPDSRDLLEVLRRTFLGRERAPREDLLGSGRIP